MFEISDRFSRVQPDGEDESYENNRYHNINHVMPPMADAESQKIALPRGSALSRFAPEPYYYLASKSGAMPSWVIDQLQPCNRAAVP
jgi:hypothetical protein